MKIGYQKKYFFILCLFLCLIAYSCFEKQKNTINEESINKTTPPLEKNLKENIFKLEERSLENQKSIELLKSLQNQAPLLSFFDENWKFVFHKDDRCEGATDGFKTHLKPNAIDGQIELEVLKDGLGWMCAAQKPKKITISFRLFEYLFKWDRFEGVLSQDKTVFYIFGMEESEYIKVYFNKKGLIHQLEYKIEDPG